MLSKTALSAMKALVSLAALPEGKYEGAASVARKIGAPQNYLSKQLKALTRTGLVESQKGLGGGFRLGRDSTLITLIEVIDPIDNVSRWERCFLGGSCSCATPCAVHNQWSAVRQSYLDFLAETTIADLVEKEGGQK